MANQRFADRKNNYGLGQPMAPAGPLRRMFRETVRYLSHRFILNRRSIRTVQAGGFRLTVRATVFHPRLFLTSEFFAKFIGTLDLSGKRAADVGTGSGILALAAVRAGSSDVLAIDINPDAIQAANDNAEENGLAGRVTTFFSNLMAGVPAEPTFDVIISNPPYFPGEPRDIVGRAWVAGPDYRDILLLFEQARQRLTANGRMYVLLSSGSDFHFLADLIAKARFRARVVSALSILIESIIVYELVPT
jgi:methylase of polypeptide subunit release factors